MITKEIVEEYRRTSPKAGAKSAELDRKLGIEITPKKKLKVKK